MLFIIQVINIIWTNKSRGHPGSVLRNKIPDKFKLPNKPILKSSNSSLFHYFYIAERYNFIPKESIEFISTQAHHKAHCITLQKDGTVFYRHDYDGGGKPQRQYYNKSRELFKIKLDEWGQIKYNGRFVCIDTGKWWYEQKTHNIACTSDYQKKIFFNSSPNHSYQNLVSLF